MDGVIQKPCNYDSVKNAIDEFVLDHPLRSKKIDLSHNYCLVLDGNNIRARFCLLSASLYFHKDAIHVKSIFNLNDFQVCIKRYPVKYVIINLEMFDLGLDEIKRLEALDIKIVLLADKVLNSYMNYPVYKTHLDKKLLHHILSKLVNVDSGSEYA